MPPGSGKELQVALANQCSQTGVDGPPDPTFKLWFKTEKQVYYPSPETYGSSDLHLHSSVNKCIVSDNLQHHEAEHSQERERGSNQSSNETEHSQGKEKYTLDVIKTECSLRKEIVAVDDETEDRGSISNPSLLEDEKFIVTFKNFKTDGRIRDQYVVSKYPTAKREVLEGLLEFKIDFEPFEGDIREDLQTISLFSVPPQLKNKSHFGMYKVAEVDSNGVCAKSTQVLDKPPKMQVSERFVTADLKAHHIAPELGHEPAVTLRKKLNMVSRKLLSVHTSEMDELTDRTKECYSNKLTWEIYQLAKAGLTHLKCLALEVVNSSEEQTMEELVAGAYQHVCRLLKKREKEIHEYEWVQFVLDSDFGAHQCAPGKEKTHKRKGEGGEITDSGPPPHSKRIKMTQHDADGYSSETTHSTASVPRFGDKDNGPCCLMLCIEDSYVVTHTPRGSFLACKDIDRHLLDDKKRELGQLHSRAEHGLTFNGQEAELFCQMPKNVRLIFEKQRPPIKLHKDDIDACSLKEEPEHIPLRMEFVQRVEAGHIKFWWTGFQKPVQFTWPIPQSMRMIILSNGNPFFSSQLERRSVQPDLSPPQMTPQGTHIQTTHQATPPSYNGVAGAPPHTTEQTYNILERKPESYQLNPLKYMDRNGRVQRIRILDKIAVKWHEVGRNLRIAVDQLDIIKQRENNDPTKCASAMVTKWLESGEHPTWAKLIEALEDSQLNDLVESLNVALREDRLIQ